MKSFLKGSIIYFIVFVFREQSFRTQSVKRAPRNQRNDNMKLSVRIFCEIQWNCNFPSPSCNTCFELVSVSHLSEKKYNKTNITEICIEVRCVSLHFSIGKL